MADRMARLSSEEAKLTALLFSASHRIRLSIMFPSRAQSVESRVANKRKSSSDFEDIRVLSNNNGVGFTTVEVNRLRNSFKSSGGGFSAVWTNDLGFSSRYQPPMSGTSHSD